MASLAGHGSSGEVLSTNTDERHAPDGGVAPERGTPDAVRHSRGLMAERYQSATMNVDDGMMEEGVEPTVENMEVNIVMLPSPELRDEFRDQGFDSSSDTWRTEHVFSRAAGSLRHVKLDSLFDDIPDNMVQRGRTFRVVAISSAGCGKTTVFTKVAPMRWARGDLWSGLFDLVVARELRCEDVRLTRSARDILDLDRLMLSTGELREVLEFVRCRPERVCLVLDGLDETALSRCSSFVQDVMRGEEMRGIRLILTSRPSGDIFQLTDGKKQDRKVDLVGFSPCDVEKYVRKFLNGKEAAQLLEKMEGNPHLLAMMCTPVLASEVCKLFHWRRQVPRCVADIFEMMVLRLAERRSAYRYESWNEVPNDVRQSILSLGRFAFKMLQVQQLVFSEAELLPYGEATSLGLLVACDRTPENHVKQWRFSHLTLQESLAAKYVASSGSMSGGKIVELVEYFGPDAGHMRMFWVLLSANLDNAHLELLINSLLLREKYKHDCGQDLSSKSMTMISPMSPTSLEFPHRFGQVLCERLSRSAMNRLAEILLATVTSGSGVQYVESKMSRVHSPRDGEFLQALLVTWAEECPVADEGMLLEAVTSVDRGTAEVCREIVRMGTLSSLPSASPWLLPYSPGLRGCNVWKFRCDLCFQCYAEHALHHDGDIEPSTTITAMLTERQAKTQSVSVDGVWLLANSEPWLLRSQTIVIRHHQHCVHRLGFRGFGLGHGPKIPAGLTGCTEIVELTFAECWVDGEGLCDFILSTCSTLESLYFRRGRITTTGMKCLTGPLLAASKLTKLTIHCNGISPDSIEQLANVLPRATSLTELDLEGSIWGNKMLLSLTVGLCECTMLEQLDISIGGLSSSLLPDMITLLQNLPGLKSCDLSYQFSHATEEQWQEFMAATETLCTIVHSQMGLPQMSYH